DLVRAAVAHQHQVGQQRERHHGAEHQPEEGSTDRVHAMRSVRATEASMQGTGNRSALRRSAKVSLTGRLACHGAGAWWARHDDDRARSYSPSSATIPDSAVPDVNANMNEPLPVVRLKNAWNSTHPWIFQRLVEKPAQRPKPGSIVDVVGVDGAFIGRGFYNGHSRIALRMLERDPDVAVDAGWFV